MIFPEGATTNGTSIIQFKKGAFESLLPIQPYCLSIWALRGRYHHGDATYYLWYMIFVMGTVL